MRKLIEAGATSAPNTPETQLANKRLRPNPVKPAQDARKALDNPAALAPDYNRVMGGEIAEREHRR